MSLSLSVGSFRTNLRFLYEGATPQAHRFRYALLVFDLATLLFIVATSFTPRNDLVETLDVLFGLILLTDFAARLFITGCATWRIRSPGPTSPPSFRSWHRWWA